MSFMVKAGHLARSTLIAQWDYLADSTRIVLARYPRSMNASYAEYLTGKRVALVGPAPSVVGSAQRYLIESHDVVVRINKALPVPTSRVADIGQRTDVLYNCLNPNEDSGGHYNIALWQRNIQFLCCPYPEIKPFGADIRRFRLTNRGRVPFHVISKQLYLDTAKAVASRPNSGIGAIVDLLSHDIAELYITGFTFFKGGYLPEYRQQSEQDVLAFMATTGHHQQEPQRRLLRDLRLRDGRIHVDNILDEILKEP